MCAGVASNAAGAVQRYGARGSPVGAQLHVRAPHVPLGFQWHALTSRVDGVGFSDMSCFVMLAASLVSTSQVEYEALHTCRLDVSICTDTLIHISVAAHLICYTVSFAAGVSEPISGIVPPEPGFGLCSVRT